MNSTLNFSQRPRLGLSFITLVVLFVWIFCIHYESAVAAGFSNGFEIKRGINITLWFTWPRFALAPSKGFLWPPFTKQYTPPNASELRALREAGFDSVRLAVDPALFMAATPEQKTMISDLIFSGVELILRAGLKVIFDLHPNSAHAVWGDRAIVRDIDSDVFRAYSDAVEYIAIRLRQLPASSVALELMNEPRLKCQGEEQEKWQTMQQRLHARARSVAPYLTLIMTGACGGSIQGLLALDPKSIMDPYTYYSIHVYEPFAFTHQGAAFIPWPEKYLTHVPWPAETRNINDVRNAVDSEFGKYRGDPIANRIETLSLVHSSLDRYYRGAEGPDQLSKAFRVAAGWADRHGINRRSIYLGEFGVIPAKENIRGALCKDRVHWLFSVRTEAEHQGFAWAFFGFNGSFASMAPGNIRIPDTDTLISLGLLSNRRACER